MSFWTSAVLKRLVTCRLGISATKRCWLGAVPRTAVTGGIRRLVLQPGKDRGYAYLVLDRLHVRDLSGEP